MRSFNLNFIKQYDWYQKLFTKWNYLGHTKLTYTNKGTEVMSRVIHFWAKGDALQFRKISNFRGFHDHDFYQTHIFTWLNDRNENLYHPIFYPSAWLKEYTKNTSGFEFINDRWVKPVPKHESSGNVISFARKD